MKTLTFTILLASTILFSCKNSPKAMDSTSIVPSKTKTINQTKTAEKDIVYDVILSFISKASGIDHVLKEKIDDALAASNKKYGTTLKPEIVHWGREGEIDYLLITKNLSTKQMKELEGDIREAIGSSDMVHVTYNQKSVHKR